MRVYISGKITGLPFDEVENNFNAAQMRLEEEGFAVVNPLDNGMPPGGKWIEHMKADIKLLMECDTIYLLNNWKHSEGAIIERYLAISLGYDVIEQIK
ncbi:MAG TPA: hypothetical protein DDW85_02435 [Porphyromonadaceae bacterium]|nr:hypothetical protein [Porphyromonadaceae bacterium]